MLSWISGLGIGSYHFASLLGRLTATATLRRFGERRVVLAAGLLAAAGLLTAVTATAAAGAIGGLLLVGFAIAPVVPATLSPSSSAPSPSACSPRPQACGSLAALVLTSLAIAGLATRWPAEPATPAG